MPLTPRKALTVWSACASTVCKYRAESLVLAEVLLGVAADPAVRPDVAEMAHVLGSAVRALATYGRVE